MTIILDNINILINIYEKVNKTEYSNKIKKIVDIAEVIVDSSITNWSKFIIGVDKEDILKKICEQKDYNFIKCMFFNTLTNNEIDFLLKVVELKLKN